MDKSYILSKVDHTFLKQTASTVDIIRTVDEGIKFGTASVCIPPCFVEVAVHRSNGRIPVCTVIGFPNGNSTTAIKVAETQEAVKLGASEIDCVINIGMLKSGNSSYVLEELKEIRRACEGKILKVIVETCLLTEDEIIQASRLVTASGADYIKTSTGFSTRGASMRDIELFKEGVGKNVKIKAAGGIKSFEDGEKFILAGCDRLGTSTLVKIAKEGENTKPDNY